LFLNGANEVRSFLQECEAVVACLTLDYIRRALGEPDGRSNEAVANESKKAADDDQFRRGGQ
jgi:hypothetical protein